MAQHDRFYIGVGGHVVAIDAASGTEIWRAHLKGSDVVTVYLAGNHIVAGTKGEVFCVDAATGTVVWQNKLKGLGTGFVAFGSPTDAPLAAAKAARDAAAAAAGAG